MLVFLLVPFPIGHLVGGPSWWILAKQVMQDLCGLIQLWNGLLWYPTKISFISARVGFKTICYKSAMMAPLQGTLVETHCITLGKELLFEGWNQGLHQYLLDMPKLVYQKNVRFLWPFPILKGFGKVCQWISCWIFPFQMGLTPTWWCIGFVKWHNLSPL